jgi:hypothetical protein
MLLADFLAAAVPILPFVFFPILQARIVSGVVIVACSSESELDVRKTQRDSDGDRDRFDRYRLCTRWRRD